MSSSIEKFCSDVKFMFHVLLQIFITEQQAVTTLPATRCGVGEVIEAKFDAAWRNKVIQFQVPLFSEKTKGAWVLRFDDVNEELLDCLLKTMEPPGYQLHFEKLYYIYKQYIRVRFGNLERAAKVAQIHRKQLQDQERWPSDWPERVSMELFIEEMRHRGKELLLEDYRMLEGLCRTAKESGYPPVLSDPQRKRLDSLYNWKKAYEMMGIPALNKPARAHMIRYWDHERKKTEEK